MIRPVLTEIALFMAPFMWLTIAALVLLLGSFLVIAQFSHSPPGSSYVPAHVEGGKLVPGEAK